jgi:hypothetical protein
VAESGLQGNPKEIWDLLALGQQISKAIYDVLNSSKKRTKNHNPEHHLFLGNTQDSIFWWGKLETPKCG